MAVKYLRLPIDEEGNFDDDNFIKIDGDKNPVLIQKSALQNRLVLIASKKVKLQKDINDLSIDEDNTLSEIDSINSIIN